VNGGKVINSIDRITAAEFGRIIEGKINLSDYDKLKHIDYDEYVIENVKPLTHEMIKSGKKSNFWKSVKATLAGETTAGVIGGEIINLLKRFIPFGEVIDATADRIGSELKSKRTKPVMRIQKKPWYKSKTINSIIAVLVLLAVQVFGIDIVEADLQAVVVAVGTAISSVIAIWGRITAKQEIGGD
jgi:hypothetical protein